MKHLVAAMWLLLALLTLFPIPLLWLVGGIAITLVISVIVAKQSARQYLWFLPCVPLIIAWFVPLPLPNTLAPLLHLGLTLGTWLTVLILLLNLTIYVSQRTHPTGPKKDRKIDQKK